MSAARVLAELVPLEGAKPVDHLYQEVRAIPILWARLRALGAPLTRTDLDVWRAAYLRRKAGTDPLCTANPSRATLAMEAGYSEGTVFKSLQRLHNWGVVHDEGRDVTEKLPNGRRRPLGRTPVLTFARITHQLDAPPKRPGRPRKNHQPLPGQLALDLPELEWGDEVVVEVDFVARAVAPRASDGVVGPAPQVAPETPSVADGVSLPASVPEEKTPSGGYTEPRQPPTPKEEEGRTLEGPAVLAGCARTQACGPAPARDARTCAPDPEHHEGDKTPSASDGVIGSAPTPKPKAAPHPRAAVYLGMRVQPVVDSAGSHWVERVDPKGPAARGGVRDRDVVVSIGGRQATPEQLAHVLQRARPGDRIPLQVVRWVENKSGKEVREVFDLGVVPTRRPDSPGR